MAVTSANRSGEASSTSASMVLAGLGGRVDLVIDGGETPGGQPSTVVDCSNPKFPILRPGPITEKAIRSALERAEEN
jgi:L-threonylcarbamoyladenylate synthase